MDTNISSQSSEEKLQENEKQVVYVKQQSPIEELDELVRKYTDKVKSNSQFAILGILLIAIAITTFQIQNTQNLAGSARQNNATTKPTPCPSRTPSSHTTSSPCESNVKQ